MASTTSNRERAWTFDVSPSPETMYHFPSSPGEPGKFDFYRVHLANHACYPDSMLSQNSDAPSLAAPSISSSITKRRWTPFADIVSSDRSQSSLLPISSSSANSIPTSKSQLISTSDSSIVSNTNVRQNESIQPVGSFSSLTDMLKNAMNKGHLDIPSTQMRRPISGTTLSTKDLNHLSPQSM